MKKRTKHMLGFLAALTILIGTGVALTLANIIRPSQLVEAIMGLGLVAGTVAYKYPTVIAPTAVQMAQNAMLTAQITMGDSDTTDTITHNWGLSATELLDLFPVPIWYIVTPGTAEPILSFVLGTNTVVVHKVSAAGSGGVYNVVLLRPHTNIRSSSPAV